MRIFKLFSNFLKKLFFRKSLSLPSTVNSVSIIGFVDEINSYYTYGWVCDSNAPQNRLTCEAYLSSTQEIIGTAIADKFCYGPIQTIGDHSSTYSFWIKFKRLLTKEEEQFVLIRVKENNENIPFSPNILRELQPFLHLAMDTVNNCNLRCPFCLYDYATTKKTNFMSDETLDAALRFLPYVRDGEFWFSCLHEPSLHPKLMEFIDKVPDEYRKKIFFTTNLAKKMPDEYFSWLVKTNLHHINISVESLVPDIYEKFRKGARFHIFYENLNKLVKAMKESGSTLSIRYIAMAYQSNLKELPDLSRLFIEQYYASQFEMRNTYDVPFIAEEFRTEEFLKDDDWDWLEETITNLNDPRIQLFRPARADDHVLIEEPVLPTISQHDDGQFQQGHYILRLSWDGSLEINAFTNASRAGMPIEKTMQTLNIQDIHNPREFIQELISNND